MLSPNVGLDTHTADIAKLIEFEDLRDVILVGHSYDGMVVTGTANRAASRIGLLVYLDAAIPRDGEALIDVSPGLLALAGQIRIVDGVELGLWPDSAASMIYGLAGHASEKWAIERLTPHPWKTLTDRVNLRDPEAFAALPRAIINCRETLARRPPELLSRWAEAAIVCEIDAAHDVMLTDPDMLSNLLLSLH